MPLARSYTSTTKDSELDADCGPSSRRCSVVVENWAGLVVVGIIYDRRFGITCSRCFAR